MRRLLLVMFVCLVSSIVSAQSATPSSKLAWDQLGQSVALAQSGTYKLYVDGGTALTVTAACEQGPSAADATCSAPFPALTPGPHTVTLTQTIGGAESPQSSALAFSFIVVVTPSGLRIQ